MWDEMKKKESIQVTMCGDEYERYVKNHNVRFNKFMTKFVMILIGAFGFVLIVAGIVSILNGFFPPTPIPPSTLVHDYLQIATVGAGLSWSVWLKFFIVLMLPFVAISWVFHGVQFKILA